MNAPEFEKFWKAWPANGNRYSRKGGKSACLAVWNKRYHFSQADTIIKHVEWLKTTEDWLKDGGAFIPAPLVYLNQQRWDGADVPEAEVVAEHRAVVSTRQYLASEAKRVPTGPSDEVKARLASIRQATNRGQQ